MLKLAIEYGAEHFEDVVYGHGAHQRTHQRTVISPVTPEEFPNVAVPMFRFVAAEDGTHLTPTRWMQYKPSTLEKFNAKRIPTGQRDLLGNEIFVGDLVITTVSKTIELCLFFVERAAPTMLIVGNLSTQGYARGGQRYPKDVIVLDVDILLDGASV